MENLRVRLLGLLMPTYHGTALKFSYQSSKATNLYLDSIENGGRHMQVFGSLLFIWGVLDFVLSWMGIDLYWEVGVDVPEDIYPFTAWIAMGLGALLFQSGRKR